MLFAWAEGRDGMERRVARQQVRSQVDGLNSGHFRMEEEKERTVIKCVYSSWQRGLSKRSVHGPGIGERG